MNNFHDYMGRIWGLAIIDVLGTVLFVGATALYFGFSIQNTAWLMVYVFIIGELIHAVFDIKTPILFYLNNLVTA